MPLIGCTAVFNKGADGEGHFEVYTKLNKIKILFNLGESQTAPGPVSGPRHDLTPQQPLRRCVEYLPAS